MPPPHKCLGAHQFRQTMQTSLPAFLLIVAAFVSSTDGPLDRHHHALTWDAAGRRVMMFGGTRVDEDRVTRFFSDLWAWNGRGWEELAGDTAQDRMSGHYFFAGSGGALFFVGGTPARAARWQGSAWKVLGDAPQFKSGGAAAFDTHRDRYVIFGGIPRPGVVSDEMVQFDGEAWRRIDAPGPPALGLTAMAYDERRRRMVLFGGRKADRGLSGETWTWDGVKWERLGVPGPPARMNHGMVYDAARGEIVLFGGSTQPYRLLGDTWIWNGSVWRQADSPAPPARGGPGMAFDRSRGVTVMFGGAGDDPVRATLGDTWEWDGRTWRLAHRGR